MIKLIMYAAFVVTIVACNNKSNSFKDKREDQTTTMNLEVDKEAADQVAAIVDTTTVVQNFTPPRIVPDKTSIVDTDRKIVKTANIKLELEKFDDFNVNIRKAIKQLGGYVASEEQENTAYQLQNSITIKVPVDRFEDLLNTFGGSGVKVLERNISTEDVSADYVDSKARMEARKRIRERYIELLKEAKKMSDILSIQSEINTSQEEVEAAAGRMQYLKQQAAYSTIHLTYLQYVNGKSPEQPGFITKMNEAFDNGFQIIANVVLVFISLWPLIAAGLILFLFIKKFRPVKVKS